MGADEYVEFVDLTVSIDGYAGKEVKSCVKGSKVHLSLPTKPISGERYQRKIGIDWSGKGSIPKRSDYFNIDNGINFTISENTKFVWKLGKQYRLLVFVDGEGTVSNLSKVWYRHGETAQFTAKPKEGHKFRRWCGNLINELPTIKLTVDYPYTLIATFIQNNTRKNNSAVKRTIISNSAGKFFLQAAPGWNMLSVPINPKQKKLSSILSQFQFNKGFNSTVWEWDAANRRYKLLEELKACSGFMIFNESKEYISRYLQKYLNKEW